MGAEIVNTHLKIILADDHPLVLVGIKAALGRIPGLQVVAECGNGDEALQALLDCPADLMILDISMPGLPADRLIEHARSHRPGMKVLILSASDEEAKLRRFAQVPIDGYLLKEEAPESLCQAVRVILQGATWFIQSVAQRLFRLSQSEADDSPFSEREKRMLQLVNLGTSNQGIALALNLARQTVSNLLSALYQKMGVSNRLEAMIWLQTRPEYCRAS